MCRQVCFKCIRSVKLCSCICIIMGTRAHTRTHARVLVYWELLSARGCTLVDQGNFALTCVIGTHSPHRDAGYAHLVGCPVCVGFCYCCHCICSLARIPILPRPRERVCTRVSADFSFDSWRSSRICKCVCAGSMHQRIRAMALFRLFKHLANLHERD